jgi:hypothetical protein
MQAIPRGETQHTGICSLERVTIRSVPQQFENRCCNIVYWYVNSLWRGCTKRWRLMKQEFLEEFADFCSSLAQAVIMLLARRQIHKKKKKETVFLLCEWFLLAVAAVFCVHNNPTNMTPWWCRSPLIWHGIYGYSRSYAPTLFQRGRAGGWLKQII